MVAFLKSNNNLKKMQLKEVLSTKRAKISVVEGSNIAVIEALDSYIPIEEFKVIFQKTGELVKLERISKLIFDKTKLKVFHQPSMEWYFTEWKEEMFHLGLKTHRKILPNDKIFQESVRIGRLKIYADFPNHKFHQMDIQYAGSIEEAIKN
jgi:hypothetical protein